MAVRVGFVGHFVYVMVPDIQYSHYYVSYAGHLLFVPFPCIIYKKHLAQVILQ